MRDQHRLPVFPSSVRGFDVAPDGRFLVVSSAPDAAAANGTHQRIVAVQHWLDGLHRQLAAAP